jgi:hypothetical protein
MRDIFKWKQFIFVFSLSNKDTKFGYVQDFNPYHSSSRFYDITGLYGC